MMKKYILLLWSAIIVTITSCTQNNGHIGEWFGEWHLASIEIDGADDNTYSGNIVWKFQNDIIEMAEVNATGHTLIEHYGTWADDGSMLILNFTHSDNANPAGSDRYSPPAPTYLPAAVVSLKILKLSSREIILQYNPLPDKSIIYTLRKRG